MDGAKRIIEILSEKNESLQSCVFGNSKIFYKPRQAKILMDIRIEAEYNATVKVQSFIRRANAYNNIYLKYREAREEIRYFLKQDFENDNLDVDDFEGAINEAIKLGMKGWKEVKEGGNIIELVRQRQSVALRLKTLLGNWSGTEGAAALGVSIYLH